MTRTKNGQISLRGLARELGVSASYLSQVKHGKRVPSQKLLNMLSNSKAGFDLISPWSVVQIHSLLPSPLFDHSLSKPF